MVRSASKRKNNNNFDDSNNINNNINYQQVNENRQEFKKFDRSQTPTALSQIHGLDYNIEEVDGNNQLAKISRYDKEPITTTYKNTPN